jgi:NlpC/P60 family putative phage cell wall peptidase
MTELEIAQRRAVVAEARSWLGTPYHHEAQVKGAGVDCAQLLIGVFSAPGVALIEPLDVPRYPPDWHLHRSAERYLAIVLDHAREIAGPPGPGDIVLWRFGRCFSHGAIVVDWPTVIHAYVGRACVLEDAEAAVWLSTIGERAEGHGRPRPRRFFSLWPSERGANDSTRE